MLLVKRPVGFPNSVDEVQQFPHALAQRHVAALALGLQATIQRSHGRVMDDGRASGVPEVVADQE
jgi:hypothetical protein